MNKTIRMLIVFLMPFTSMGALTVNNGGGATNITSTSAWITATIVSTGAANPYLYSYWGTNNGSTNVTSWGHTNSYGISTQGTYSAHITGLSGSTIYYFRTRATNTYATTNSESAWASYTAQFITLTTPTSVPPSSVRAVTADTDAVLKNPTNFFWKNVSKIHDALSVYGYLTNEALWIAASGSVVYATDSTYTDTVAKAAAAYPSSNPSNFVDATITNDLNEVVGTKVTTNDTRQLDFTGADVRVADATETNQPVTKSQLDANSGTTNASGIHVAFTPTNYTPVSADVEGHLLGVDGALGSVEGVDTNKSYTFAAGTTQSYDNVEIRGVLRMTNSESAGELEAVEPLIDVENDDLYYVRRNGVWYQISYEALLAATNAHNIRLGVLEVSTNAINIRVGALECSSNAINTRVGVLETSTITGGTVVAGSANTFAVADRIATVTWNTNDAAGGGGEGVNTNTAYVFNTNIYAMGFGQKVRDVGLISGNTTLDPNLGTYIKMQYTGAVFTATVANLPAGYAVPITIELQHSAETNATKTTIYWSTNVFWPGGWSTNLSFSATANAFDTIQLFWNGTRYNVINGAYDSK